MTLRLVATIGLLAACSSTNQTLVRGDGGDAGESSSPTVGGKTNSGGVTSGAGTLSRGGTIGVAGATSPGGTTSGLAGAANGGATGGLAGAANGGVTTGVAGAANGGTMTIIGGTTSVGGATNIGGTTAGVAGIATSGGTMTGVAGMTTGGSIAGSAGAPGVAGAAGAPAFCIGKPVGTVCGKPGSSMTCQSEKCVAPSDFLGMSTLALGATAATSTFDDDCPSGHFLVGFEAGVKGGTGTHAIAGFAALCSPVSLATLPDGNYILTVDSATVVRVPVTGVRGAVASFEKTPTQFMCEAGGIVIAIKGSEANGQVVSLSAVCSKPAAGFYSTSTVEFGLRVTTAVDTAIQQSGAYVAGSVTTLDCPVGSVPRGVRTLTGDGIDGLALRCAALPFALPTSTPGAGDMGGAARLDACPSGQAMTGIVTSVGSPGSDQAGRFAHWTTHCGVVSVDPISSSVTISGDTAVPATLERGTFSPSTQLPPLKCPTDQVVVGIEGTLTARPLQVALRCSALSVGEISGQWVGLKTGAVATLDLAGTVTGANAFGPYDCPPGTAAIGTSTRSGEVLNRVALLCAEIAINP